MPSPSILVAGGAGYIGAHFCKAAAAAGFTPVVLDRLSCSSPRVEAFRRGSVKWGPLEVADYGDAEAVQNIIAKHKPMAAVCFAALIEVGESTTHPDLYWENNFVKAARFFSTLEKTGLTKLVFSSTAAVYGIPPNGKPLTETDAPKPVNNYGMTKLGCSVMLRGAEQVGASPEFVSMLDKRLSPLPKFEKLKSVVFRYFNAGGASPEAGLGEMHEPETHLIPTALFAAGQQRDYAGGQKPFTFLGTDYDTRDGTTIRDYVHVEDLAAAHIAGLNYLLDGGENEIFNLGAGLGYSVREVVETVRSVTGKNFTAVDGPRRMGDPPVLVANASKAASILSWKPQRDLREMVKSAHAFHSKNG